MTIGLTHGKKADNCIQRLQSLLQKKQAVSMCSDALNVLRLMYALLIRIAVESACIDTEHWNTLECQRTLAQDMSRLWHLPNRATK